MKITTETQRHGGEESGGEKAREPESRKVCKRVCEEEGMGKGIREKASGGSRRDIESSFSLSSLRSPRLCGEIS